MAEPYILITLEASDGSLVRRSRRHTFRTPTGWGWSEDDGSHVARLAQPDQAGARRLLAQHLRDWAAQVETLAMTEKESADEPNRIP